MGTCTAMRISRSGSSSVHGPWSSSPSNVSWNHEYSTQRRWLTRPEMVISGEVAGGARRASVAETPAHFACTVARA